MIVLTNDESAGDIRSGNALRVVGSRGARSTTLQTVSRCPVTNFEIELTCFFFTSCPKRASITPHPMSSTASSLRRTCSTASTMGLNQMPSNRQMSSPHARSSCTVIVTGRLYCCVIVLWWWFGWPRHSLRLTKEEKSKFQRSDERPFVCQQPLTPIS